jgi:hypothetical protein
MMMPDKASHIGRIACCILVASGMTGFHATGQGTGGKDLILSKPDGTVVHVPKAGPFANEAAQQAAQGVLDYDRRVKSHRPDAHADPQVAKAIQDIADETRNEAVEQIDLAYRVPTMSSGPLDLQLIENAKRNVALLREIMSTPPPPSLMVHTAVSSSIPKAVLHYCLRADYLRKSCDWHTYTPGALMPIGRYMFRVESPDSAATREEVVLVLNDPTQQSIEPMR